LKTIVLANHKGGYAKTTTALNLGVLLAKQGSRTLAVDLDPQANLLLALGKVETLIGYDEFTSIVDEEDGAHLHT
jgi:cellulose biosynthesis protein BcsQ